jgi:hypothetical protein
MSLSHGRDRVDELHFDEALSNGAGGTCLIKQKALGNWRWSLILIVHIDEELPTSCTRDDDKGHAVLFEPDGVAGRPWIGEAGWCESQDLHRSSGKVHHLTAFALPRSKVGARSVRSRSGQMRRMVVGHV